MIAKKSAMALAALFTMAAYASDGGVAVPAKMFPQPVIDLALPKADATAQVLLQQDFEGLSALPEGWSLIPWSAGSARVENGALFIDGRAHSTNMTGVALPAELQSRANYRIDVTFTFLETNNASRWGSVMYRTASVGNPTAYEPYYQFAIRRDATASNGTEVALRRNNAWNVQAARSYSENIDPNKLYKATVIVYGNRVRQYLNDVLIHDAVLDEAVVSGGIGLQTAGLVMKVESVTVTEQLSALPEIEAPVLVQHTGTSAAMAPTLVQAMQSAGDPFGTGASNAFYAIDSALNLSSPDSGNRMGTLEAYMAQPGRVTIPVLYVRDEATLQALQRYTQDVRDLSDVTLISDDEVLLKQARALMPALRTAVDFSQTGAITSDADIVAIVGATNRAGGKIAVLPAEVLTKDVVAHLQRLLITVWAVSDASDAAGVASVLATGVNGVVTEHAGAFTRVLRALPAGSLLRNPLVIGHRGMPSREDENTLEGALAAADVGADAIESDVYLTTDGHVVVMHDATVNRTTNGVGNIESMTLAQVQALRTQPKGYAVPTLRQYLQAFADRDITQVIEVKSAKPEIIEAVKQEIAAAGVQHQSVVISFSSAQLRTTNTVFPDLTTGFLTNAPSTGSTALDVREILAGTQQNSSTFNPSFGNLTSAAMEEAKHRGTTFWPWTINNAQDFYRFYSQGTHGITTDHAYLAEAFPIQIEAARDVLTVNEGEAWRLPVVLTTKVRDTLQAHANEPVVLDGTATYERLEDGALRFTQPGTAVVLPGYRHQMPGGQYSYVIYDQPLTVQVLGEEEVIDAIANSPAGGAVACAAAPVGASSACTVSPAAGYRVRDGLPDGNCTPGEWNESRTVYTTGAITGACSVSFAFEALPATVALGAIGALQAGVTGGGEGLWTFDPDAPARLVTDLQTPEDVEFPYGVVGFELVGGEAGSAAEVVLTYPQALPSRARYYKYGVTADHAEPHWYVYPHARIEGNTVRLTLTDGGAGDNDLLANGTIADPGGIGIAADATAPGGATPVPTMGAGALVALSGLLGGLGWLRTRRPRSQRVHQRR